jgi:hypothetical protein
MHYHTLPHAHFVSRLHTPPLTPPPSPPLHLCPPLPPPAGSSNPPGRGGPWFNDPTYWIGLLLGVGLAYPLVRRFILNKTSDKEVVSHSKVLDRKGSQAGSPGVWEPRHLLEPSDGVRMRRMDTVMCLRLASKSCSAMPWVQPRQPACSTCCMTVKPHSKGSKRGHASPVCTQWFPTKAPHPATILCCPTDSCIELFPDVSPPLPSTPPPHTHRPRPT